MSSSRPGGVRVVLPLKRHTVVIAAHRQGEIRVDIADLSSIEHMYQAVDNIDSVVATMGKLKFAYFSEMTLEDYFTRIQNKLMGKVALVLIGKKYLKENGSFTLTSGMLNHNPIRAGNLSCHAKWRIEQLSQKRRH